MTAMRCVSKPKLALNAGFPGNCGGYWCARVKRQVRAQGVTFNPSLTEAAPLFLALAGESPFRTVSLTAPAVAQIAHRWPKLNEQRNTSRTHETPRLTLNVIRQWPGGIVTTAACINTLALGR
jgi:hypothetical protein